MVKKDGKLQDDAKKTIDLTNILYQLALLQGDDSRTVAFVDILLRQWGFPSIYDEDGYFYDMWDYILMVVDGLLDKGREQLEKMVDDFKAKTVAEFTERQKVMGRTDEEEHNEKEGGEEGGKEKLTPSQEQFQSIIADAIEKRRKKEGGKVS